MKPMKSAVTFFRKQLGYKGKTQHNGRGVYEMDIDWDEDYNFDESLSERIRSRLALWQEQGLVEKVEETETHLAITLKDELFERPQWMNEVEGLKNCSNQSYRTLWYGKKYGNLGVIMAF